MRNRSCFTFLIAFMVLGCFVTTAFGVSVDYQSGCGGSSVSVSETYHLDESSSLQEETALGSSGIRQARAISGSGDNTLRQQLAGNEYSVENTVGSSGMLSAYTSTAAYGDGASLDQKITGAGSVGTALQGTHGSEVSSQDANVFAGVMSASQHLEVGDGVSVGQDTVMAGASGMISSSALSEDNCMLVAGSFQGDGDLSADLRSTATGNAGTRGEVFIAGSKVLDDEYLQSVESKNLGMKLGGLYINEDGQGLGSFDLNAVNMDREVYDKKVSSGASGMMNAGDRSSPLVVSDSSAYSPGSYSLTGYRWNEEDPMIQLYLRADPNLAYEGLDTTETKNVISVAANTWDDVVEQDLFVNGETVIADPNRYADTFDGYNVHAWVDTDQTWLGLSRWWYVSEPDEEYDSIVESDVSYNSQYAWALDGSRGDNVQGVALHELGHSVGMGHADYQYVDEGMHPYYHGQITLGDGDTAGARVLYGAPVSGFNMIIAKHSGKYLDIYGALQDNGANVIQWPYNGGDNQKFKLVPVEGEDGYYHIIAKHSGKYLDLYGALQDNGVNVIQWPYNGGDNQKFKLELVD